MVAVVWGGERLPFRGEGIDGPLEPPLPRTLEMQVRGFSTTGPNSQFAYRRR
jgi:hypothetical protein